MSEPTVQIEKVTTETRSIILTEEDVIRILKDWAKDHFAFSHRAEVIDDEYFFRGVTIREEIKTNSTEPLND